MPSKKQKPARGGGGRVKMSWHEAMGQEEDAEDEPERDRGVALAPDRVEKSKPAPQQEAKKAKKKAKKAKKASPGDDSLDADALYDLDSANEVNDSLSDLADSDLEKFGGAGFVMVDLEDELDELALEATEEGFDSVRFRGRAAQATKKKKKKKKQSRQPDGEAVLAGDAGAAPAPVGLSAKETKKKAKKKRQAQKLKESVTSSNTESLGAAVESLDKKTTKQSKKEKRTEAAAAAQSSNTGKRAVQSAPASSKANKSKPTNADIAKEPAKTKKSKKKGASSSAEQSVPSTETKPSVPTSATGSQKKKTNSSQRNARDGNGRFTYAEYLDHDVVTRGLEMGSFLQGKLRVNNMNRMDGYITVDGLSMDVLVKGMEDRNRALDGDLVAIRLYPESEWKSMNGDKDEAPATKPISSSAGVDFHALHSLWLPSVDTDGCLLDQATHEDGGESVNMLKQHIAGINARIQESRRRPTASVVFVLGEGNAHGFIGSLEAKTKVADANAPLLTEDAFAYFNAHDLRLPRRIQIPRLQLPDEFISRPLLYSKTMLCFCRIKSWSTKHHSPMGAFVKTVGEYTGIETGISAILAKHGLQSHTLDFDSAILDQLDAKYGTSGEKWEIPDEEFQKRRDFRHNAQIFSIDPYNARDLDDALHIRALDEGRTKFEIGVHIADVTHFMDHGSLLDLEARDRATSVYLANRVLPMLPRILCEKLCSLQPQVDRLAFSVVWQMNVDGTLVDGVEPWFGKSIIRSCCKLDYGSAQKMLDGVISSDDVDEWEEARRPIAEANPNITNASVIQSVKDLWSIGENRRAMRFETGAVSLNDIKLVFSLDAKGNPTHYGSYQLKDSNRLVEEYMLLANFLVAQQLLRAHGPLAFLRHHPPPVERAMSLTLEQLDKNDIRLDGRSTKQLSESLERVRVQHGDTQFAIVQAMIIKPMKPAEYMVAGNGASPDSWRHYALNIPYYTHFTSPIRRYADVVVHRLLQESVSTPSGEAEGEPAAMESRVMELSSVAQNCNEKKMTSKNAEKDCDQVFLCAYVKHHGAVEVTGVVLSMGQKSFTVHILELGLEQRLFLQDVQLTGSWDEKTSQLSIRLPAPKTKKLRPRAAKRAAAEAADAAGSAEQGGKDEDASPPVTDPKPAPSEVIKLSFMKQLHMRMSATTKMPLALTFTVLGVKQEEF